VAGAPSPPPPEHPELPAGIPAPAAEQAPRWPASFALWSFLVATFTLFVLLGILSAITGTEPGEERSAAQIVAGTLLQALAFAGAAVLFASFVARPRAWQFGLRPTALWPAVGWATLGLVTFYVFAAVYGAVVPDVEQTVTEDLGADQGTLGLIVAGCVVMIVAPLAEEFFFRGFFYRALRSRFAVPVAAALDGLVFGLLHYNFQGAEGLLLVPPLALLGVIFCLVYERTGSLWPVVAMHAFNNAVAYAVQADDGWKVSVVVGPLMLLAAAVLPRVLPPGPVPARGLPLANPGSAGVQ